MYNPFEHRGGLWVDRATSWSAFILCWIAGWVAGYFLGKG